MNIKKYSITLKSNIPDQRISRTSFTPSIKPQIEAPRISGCSIRQWPSWVSPALRLSIEGSASMIDPWHLLQWQRSGWMDDFPATNIIIVTSVWKDPLFMITNLLIPNKM